jgi:hypothetical protein
LVNPAFCALPRDSSFPNAFLRASPKIFKRVEEEVSPYRKGELVVVVFVVIALLLPLAVSINVKARLETNSNTSTVATKIMVL